MARGFQIELKLLSMVPLQGERAHIRGSEYTIFEILDHSKQASLAKSAWIRQIWLS